MDLSSSEGSPNFESNQNKLQRRRERACQASETVAEKEDRLDRARIKLKSEEQLAVSLQRRLAPLMLNIFLLVLYYSWFELYN